VDPLRLPPLKRSLRRKGVSKQACDNMTHCEAPPTDIQRIEMFISRRSSMSSWLRPTLLSAAALVAFSPTALAHVALSGPGIVGQSQVLTFSVGHGCEGADTVGIEIAIPREVTTVRAAPSVFGAATVRTDETGVVTAVSWTKDDARSADDQFYTLQLRIKVPELPFTTLYFPTTQTCRSADGDETVVAWDKLPEQIEGAAQGEEVSPAPALTILPVRHAGWNKFTVPDAIEVLTIFDDAQIVWSGESAYSSNPTTMELIAGDDSVKALTKIKAGAEIWVRY
jgi:periplasmic copper chaperone A